MIINIFPSHFPSWCFLFSIEPFAFGINPEFLESISVCDGCVSVSNRYRPKRMHQAGGDEGACAGAEPDRDRMLVVLPSVQALRADAHDL